MLLADDHPAVAHSLCRWLRARFRVLAPIIDLRLIEPAVRVTRPAVLVGDLDFAGVSALSVFKRLAGLSPGPRLVVHTGTDNEVARQMCLSAGAVAFACKLEPPEVLLNAIQSALPAEPGEVTNARLVPLPIRRSSQARRHDHGPLVKWLLLSGYPQQMIAEAVGVSIKTVEYHSGRTKADTVSLSCPSPRSGGGD